MGGSVAALILGVILAGIGFAFLLDLRGVGTKAMRLSLYTGAPIWKRDPRPDPDDVTNHRVIFGLALTALGLFLTVASASTLT